MSDIGSDHGRLRCDSISQIGYLEEILINILSRLPVKNVVECKCVAKHWLRLISEPQFPVLQLNSSEKKLKHIICAYPQRSDIVTTHLSLMEENGNISRNIPVTFYENISSPEIVCFSNGLICSVGQYVDEEEYDLLDVNICVFNPTTRDILRLPRGTPSSVTEAVGFAFDPENYEFKAFRFFFDSSKTINIICKCEVYTSSSAEWRIISEGVEHPREGPFNSYTPIYVSVAGKMYWFVWSVDEPIFPKYIISVDMNDKFTEIDLPTVMHQWSYLIELESCFSVVHVDYEPGHSKPYVEVYKLIDCGWCLRAKFEMDLINIQNFNSVAARDNDIFFIAKLEDESFCYLIFDLSDGTWVTLDLVDTFKGYSPVAFPFVESLLKCG